MSFPKLAQPRFRASDTAARNSPIVYRRIMTCCGYPPQPTWAAAITFIKAGFLTQTHIYQHSPVFTATAFATLLQM
ncbi:MAG: hypothetical protein Aurels2KO_06050 [Aureliella sp.]